MQVDLTLVPAVSGDFGVMPGHVPTVAQLRPGIVAIHTEMDKDVERYFVSGGFAVMHADSTMEVTVVEAAKVEDLDKQAVKAGLAEYTARYGRQPDHCTCTCAGSSPRAHVHLQSSRIHGLQSFSTTLVDVCLQMCVPFTTQLHVHQLLQQSSEQLTGVIHNHFATSSVIALGA